MQDRGVHRKVFSKKQSLENELWKRAFWWIIHRECVESKTKILHRVLILLDRSFSTLLGRPCALQDEEYVLRTILPLRGV